MDDDYQSHPVELYIYDLTQGMARIMSQMLLGNFFFLNDQNSLI